MSISSLGVRTTNFTATTSANTEFVTGATRRARILEYSYINATTATAQSIGLGRPQAKGVSTGGSLFQADDGGEPASLVTGFITWTTSSPTVPLIFHRRWSGAATVGVGVVWTFPRGFAIAISFSVCTWNITTTVASDVNCIIDE